jgi:hypothetical protein
MKTLKREEIYANDNLEHLRTNIEDFIEQYYNQQRVHSALGYCSPEKSEQKSECPNPAADGRSATMEFFENDENGKRVTPEMPGKGTQSPSPSPDPFSYEEMQERF